MRPGMSDSFIDGISTSPFHMGLRRASSSSGDEPVYVFESGPDKLEKTSTRRPRSTRLAAIAATQKIRNIAGHNKNTDSSPFYFGPICSYPVSPPRSKVTKNMKKTSKSKSGSSSKSQEGGSSHGSGPNYHQLMQQKIAEHYDHGIVNGYRTESFGDFTVIRYPQGGCCMPPQVGLLVQHVPTKTWKRYSDEDYERLVSQLKKVNFDYPEGFTNRGPLQSFGPGGYPGPNWEPADELMVPVHNYAHSLEFSYREFGLESVYAEDYVNGKPYDIDVKVTHLTTGKWKVFKASRKELERQKKIANFGYPTGFQDANADLKRNADNEDLHVRKKLWQAPLKPMKPPGKSSSSSSKRAETRAAGRR